MEHLDAALKALKKDKARDPNGWCNELFKDGVAGKSLKLSLLNFLNKMKIENEIADFVRLADVSTLYKGKGSKFDLLNDRGIFIVTILRSILMRLIYLDYYTIIDESMSDSQVGGVVFSNIIGRRLIKSLCVATGPRAVRPTAILAKLCTCRSFSSLEPSSFLHFNHFRLVFPSLL